MVSQRNVAIIQQILLRSSFFFFNPLVPFLIDKSQNQGHKKNMRGLSTRQTRKCNWKTSSLGFDTDWNLYSQSDRLKGTDWFRLVERFRSYWAAVLLPPLQVALSSGGGKRIVQKKAAKWGSKLQAAAAVHHTEKIKCEMVSPLLRCCMPFLQIKIGII